MQAGISQACPDRLKDLFCLSIIPEIWTSENPYIQSIKVELVVTRSTSSTGDYIPSLVCLLVCHHFSPPSLGYSVHCESELIEMVPVESLECGDTSRVT